MSASVEFTRANGSAARDEFPAETFKDAAPHLRRPFTPEAVKFKVQATWPKDNPSGGLIVGYIDARLVVERLNLVVPHLWYDAYEPLGQKHLICRLTVDGITRTDIGEGQGKGLYSDALKRAAVKFGVGVSLYAIPKMMLNASDGTLKQKQAREGLTLELTSRGETLLRSMYAGWLDRHGSLAFGEPLDHGDVEGAAGDPEEAVHVDPDTGEVLIGEERAAALLKATKTLVDGKVWTAAKLRAQLVAAGARDASSSSAAIRSLTGPQADVLEAAMAEAVKA